MSNFGTSIPSLKHGITIAEYEDTVPGTPQRYLLGLGTSYFLISIKSRALIVALMRSPQTHAQLEVDFAREGGQHVSASTLIALAEQTLPAALFSNTSMVPRKLPFTVSMTVLGPRIAARLTACLGWLFRPAWAVSLMTVFLILHGAVLPRVFALAPVAPSAREAAVLAAIFLLSGLMHELGHAAACRHFRCPHGGIGFGLYLVFPVWFADVTHAWRLKRRQRAVVDLGGVYFQAIFLIAVDAYALITGNPLALKLSWLITFAMLFTLNPVFKFDGYWLLSDLSGLHNLHEQVRKSIATFIATVMGKRRSPAPGMQGMVLHAYVLLSTFYFTYLGHFLVEQLHSLDTTLRPTLSAVWLTLSALDWLHGWEVAAAIARCVSLLAWPFLIALGSLFFVNFMRRAVIEIAATIRHSRALPSV